MKITHTSYTKTILAALVVSILVVGGLVGYAVYSSSWPFNGSQQTEPVNEKPSTADNDNKDIDENNPAEVENPKGGMQDEQQAKAESKSLDVTITNAYQVETSVRIRALIDTVTSNGSCELVARQNSSDAIITRTAKIQALPNGSTCTGFDIPTSEMTSGTWNTTITAKINNKSGSDKTNIEVK